MFAQDLRCKSDIVLDLEEYIEHSKAFGSGTRDALMIYILIWTEEPYIDQTLLSKVNVALAN